MRPSASHPSVGGAAGGLQSTGRDLLLFAAALADGTLLSPESQTAMQAFVPGEDYSQFGIVHGYGLGLEQYATDAITVIGHMGTGEAAVGVRRLRRRARHRRRGDDEHGLAGPQAIMAIETLTAVSEAG